MFIQVSSNVFCRNKTTIYTFSQRKIAGFKMLEELLDNLYDFNKFLN